MREPPVFISDIKEVEAFVRKCLKQDLQRSKYWSGDWTDSDDE